MRARLLGATLAALAAPAGGFAQQAPAGGVACASPALLQCSIFAPGFKRWFFAPFGIAPPDAEMAAQICPGEKGLGVASSRRRPVGGGPLAQTTVLEVACTSRTVAVRPAIGPSRLSPPVKRPALAGSPQEVTPQLERRGGAAADDRRSLRADRRARREEARARLREAEIGAVEPRRRRGPKPTDPRERRAAAPDTPVPVPSAMEKRPDAFGAETSAPTARPVPPEPAAAAAAKTAAEPSAEPKPAARPATPSKPRRTPKDDPSISYEHF